MTAPAVARRLCALIPIAIVSVLGSLLIAAPAATAGAAPQAGTTAHQLADGEKLAPLPVRINHAADVAISHIGDPYRYGAAGPSSFDCSGLSMWSYGHSSMTLPRTSASQYAAVHHILKMHLIRGDLVFFHDGSGHVYHVGMFLYWNAEHRAVIIHAPHSGTVVHRAPVWTSAWYAGTRRP